MLTSRCVVFLIVIRAALPLLFICPHINKHLYICMFPYRHPPDGDGGDDDYNGARSSSQTDHLMKICNV